MKQILRVLAFIAPAAGILACADADRGEPTGVTNSGALIAVAYVDQNLNEAFDEQDKLLPGVPVVLVRGTADTLQRRVSDSRGIAEFKNVPVGTYRVTAAPATVTDTLILGGVENGDATIAANDTAEATLRFSYASASIARIRQLPAGRRVQVRATALHAWATFDDATLHVSDSTGVLRVFRVEPATISAGDIVRLVGTTAIVEGRATLRDVSVSVIGSAAAPAPAAVTTTTAATADGGLLDAALVRITGASVLGWQQLPNGGVLASVNDGTGRLDVVFARGSGADLSRLERGANLDATGILVPGTTLGVWQLKPRTAADVQLTFPIMTVAQARAADLGRAVRLKVGALHGWAAFADGTVHVRDATGSIRVIGVPSTAIFTGDTIEVFATVAAEAGQPVLRDGSASVVALGPIPTALSITLEQAVTADAGRLDAALVRLPAATVSDTITVGRDYGLSVAVNSDTVRIVLDADAGIGLHSLLPGSSIEVTGLMVPNFDGRSWLIKPRGSADIVVRSKP